MPYSREHLHGVPPNVRGWIAEKLGPEILSLGRDHTRQQEIESCQEVVEGETLDQKAPKRNGEEYTQWLLEMNDRLSRSSRT